MSWDDWAFGIPTFGGYNVGKAIYKSGADHGNPKQIASNPYLDQQNGYLKQLQDQMNGNGPSLAEQDYKRRAAQMLQQQLMMARGRNPGAARQAGGMAGDAQRGIASGAATAGIQEKYAQQAAYAQALQNAQQNDFQRSNANLQSYWQNMAQPTGFDKLMQLGVAAGGIGAKA
jgi:hypothetical protein